MPGAADREQLHHRPSRSNLQRRGGLLRDGLAGAAVVHLRNAKGRTVGRTGQATGPAGCRTVLAVTKGDIPEEFKDPPAG